MRKTFFLSVVVICTLAKCGVAEDPVYFADANLKLAVETALGIQDPTPTAMRELMILSASYANITDLAGLEFASNLEELELSHNTISDISPLSGLKWLHKLDLSYNTISDISALTGLSGLQRISLYSNQINDISPLAGLENLYFINCSENQISDISVLGGLQSLTTVSLHHNQISNVGVLWDLPLLSIVNLTSNPLNCAACYILPKLEVERNVTVYYDPCPVTPTVTTLPATDIGSTTVTLQGSVQDDGGEACEYRFRYIRSGFGGDWQYTQWTGALITGQSFSEHVSGLWIGFTYYFNAQARNCAGVSSWGNQESFTPTFLPVYTLTVSSGSGGSVTTPGEGSYSYNWGTSVSVSATAEADHHFVNWTGSAVTAGKVASPGSAITSVTMDGDYTLIANFAADQKTLNISSSSGGSVTTPGEGSYSYDSGTSVSVSATAEADYHFVNWTGSAVSAGKVASPGSATTSVIMEGDYTLLANFAADSTAPDVSTLAATDIVESSARLNGYIIDDGGQPCEVRFCYQADGQAMQYTPWKSETIGTVTQTITGLVSGTRYSYYMEARNGEGIGTGTTLSFTTPSQQGQSITVVITSTSGGTVVEPGEGEFEFASGEEVALVAKPDPEHTFAGWTGSGVDLGYVADADEVNTTLIAETNCAVNANFLEARDVIYVDDDAPSDPGPQDPCVSDPAEDGSRDHPFDMIQEGIDIAGPGHTVHVLSGTYWETIDFKGKSIKVLGGEPNQPCPVIDAGYHGTVATFANGEGPDTVLAGFTLTRGQGDIAGGILCSSSHPLIANCLIVGNRTLNALEGGGGAYCFDSNAVFVNCTFSGNYGGPFGAGFFSDSSHNEIRNSILWDNGPFEILFPFIGNSAPPVVAYSDIASGAAGSGNISLVPLFVLPGYWADPLNPNDPTVPSDPDAIWVTGDYHLTLTSPCIDSGDPNHAPDPKASDCDGEARIYNSRIDMGADEFTPLALAPNLVASYDNMMIPLALDPNAPDPDHTLLGHAPIAMDLNFKIKLVAQVTSASVAGGTWTAWLVPDVLGPGSDLVAELWIKGEDVDMELLSAEQGEIVLARTNILAAPAQ